MHSMRKALPAILLLLLLAAPVLGQTPAPATPPVATDVTAAAIQAFIDALPRDRISDRPIRIVEVTGDYRGWSELETDIEYLIFRPDPDNRLQLR